MHRAYWIVVVLAVFVFQVGVLGSPGVGGWACVGATRAIFGTQVGSLDALDPSDSEVAGGTWYVGSYHTAGTGGWTDTGFLGVDQRSPLLPGETKIWWVYIWGSPEGPFPYEYSTRWGWSDPYNRDTSVATAFELVQKPDGITGGPAVGTVWNEPMGELMLPWYGTSDGLTGYQFSFSLTLVPEPSSLLALSGGIAFSGLSLRRRRRHDLCIQASWVKGARAD